MCIHSLLKDVYLRWSGNDDNKDEPPPRDDDPIVEPAEAIADAPEPEVVREGDGLPNGGLDAVEGDGQASDPGLLRWQAKQLEQARSRKIAVAFLLGKTCLGDLVVLRCLAGIFQRTITKLLYISGDQWESRQRASEILQRRAGKRGPWLRDYRALIVADRSLHKTCLDEIIRLLSDVEDWKLLPMACHNVEYRTQVFKALGVALALVSEHDDECKGYPWKLFLLLKRPELEEEILAEKCRFDSWTAGWVADYEVRGLSSVDALADLRSTLHMVTIDTVTIEVNHSRIRRTLVGSSCQTHTVELQDCSALELFRKLRACRSSMATTQASSRKEQPGADGRIASDGGEDVCDSSPAAKRPRRGGGGAWRAFVSLHSSRGGKPDFGQMSVDYKNLKAAGGSEYDHVLRVGSMAARAHQAGVGQVFGPNVKQIDRQAVQAWQQRIAKRAIGSSQPDEEHDASVGDAVSRSEIAVHVSLAGNVSDDLLAVKKDVAARFAMRATLQREAVQCYHEYRQADLEGGERMRAALQVIEDNSCFLPLPTCTDQFFEYLWSPDSAMTKATLLFSYSVQKQMGAKFARHLQASWEALHHCVLERPVHEIDEMPRRPVGNPCGQESMCVCAKGPCPHVKVMVANCRRALFQMGKSSQKDKYALLQHEILAIFIGRGVDDAGDALTLVDRPTETIWASIAFQWQKPHRSLWHLLVGPPLLGDDLAEIMKATYQLQSDLVAATPFVMMKRLDPRLRWDVVFFRAASDARLVGRFDPRRVDAIPLHGVPVVAPIWNPTKKRAKPAALPMWHFEFLMDSDGESEVGSAHEASGVDLWLSGGEAPIPLFFDGEDLDVAIDEAGVIEEVGAAEEMPGDDGAASEVDEEVAVAVAVPVAAAEAVAMVVVAAPVARLRRGMTDELQIPGFGRIAFYESKSEFYAICTAPGHGKYCRKVRTSRASERPGRESQGRPCGWLMGWLTYGHDLPDDESHKWGVWPTLADRTAARIALQDLPGNEALLRHERPLRDGEDAEPVLDP